MMKDSRGCIPAYRLPVRDASRMATATFACPKCQQSSRVEISPGRVIVCPHCQQRLEAPSDAWDQGKLCRCLVCPSTDLFVRKDFPQRLGVAIVVIGFALSTITWAYSLILPTFAIFFATAAIDLVLYLIVPDALMCYRCFAQYRGVDGVERHGGFNLETHERHRQHVARLGR